MRQDLVKLILMNQSAIMRAMIETFPPGPSLARKGLGDQFIETEKVLLSLPDHHDLPTVVLHRDHVVSAAGDAFLVEPRDLYIDRVNRSAHPPQDHAPMQEHQEEGRDGEKLG